MGYQKETLVVSKLKAMTDIQLTALLTNVDGAMDDFQNELLQRYRDHTPRWHIQQHAKYELEYRSE